MIRHGVKTNVKGFTLVELMVVVAIIALLATISTPNLFGFLKRTKARDGANAVASYLQNARDQAMSRGEVVLLRVTIAGAGDATIATYRAPLLETTQEVLADNTVVTRDRFASACSELSDPSLPTPYTLTNRVAVLNPQGTITTEEVAEDLDPNVRVIGFTNPGAAKVLASGGTNNNLSLCFSPDGRVFSSTGAEVVSNDGACTSSLVLLVTSDPDVGATPTPAELLGTSGLDNWVCPTTLPSDATQRKNLFTTLDVAREASFVYAVSMSFNGRVKVD